MFCSSTDSGYFNNSSYPASYKPDAIIRVGAAGPTGWPYDWAGPVENLDFIFPGVEVVQQHAGPPHGIDNLSVDTKSSVATALGAGLASLIMYCTFIGATNGRVVLSGKDVDRLRERDVMVAAIRAFGVSASKDTGGKSAEVWKKLDGTARGLERSSIAVSRELVALLARDLVSTSTST
jgi:hypothetical protein